MGQDQTHFQGNLTPRLGHSTIFDHSRKIAKNIPSEVRFIDLAVGIGEDYEADL